MTTTTTLSSADLEKLKQLLSHTPPKDIALLEKWRVETKSPLVAKCVDEVIGIAKGDQWLDIELYQEALDTLKANGETPHEFKAGGDMPGSTVAAYFRSADLSKLPASSQVFIREQILNDDIFENIDTSNPMFQNILSTIEGINEAAAPKVDPIVVRKREKPPVVEVIAEPAPVPVPVEKSIGDQVKDLNEYIETLKESLEYLDGKEKKDVEEYIEDLLLAKEVLESEPEKKEKGGGIKLSDLSKQIIEEKKIKIGDTIDYEIGDGSILNPKKLITGHKIETFVEKGKDKDLYARTDKGYLVDVYAIKNNYEEEEIEPDYENDDFISDAGRDGYSVSSSGKHIGNYKQFDEALKVLLEKRKGSNWLPTIWSVNERGSYYPIDNDGNEIKMAKGGTVVGNLEKELRKLQRDLNSNRLLTYIEGDTSEEEKARQRERESKLARFNEVRRLLNESYAEGGPVGSKYKGGDFVFAAIYEDESKKVPFIVSHWSKDKYYVLGDGIHYVAEEKLTPATEKDFDEYYGDTADSFKREFKEEGEMYGYKAGKPGLMVVNQTDGILASPETYTPNQAQKFIEEFRERFKGQGYYLTAKQERIKPEDIVLHIQPADKISILQTYETEYGDTVKGFVSTWNKALGEFEGLPVVYGVQEVSISGPAFYAVVGGILKDGVLVNPSEAYESWLGKEDDALSIAYAIAVNQNEAFSDAAEEFKAGGSMAGLKSKLQKGTAVKLTKWNGQTKENATSDYAKKSLDKTRYVVVSQTNAVAFNEDKGATDGSWWQFPPASLVEVTDNGFKVYYPKDGDKSTKGALALEYEFVEQKAHGGKAGGSKPKKTPVASKPKDYTVSTNAQAFDIAVSKDAAAEILKNKYLEQFSDSMVLCKEAGIDGKNWGVVTATDFKRRTPEAWQTFEISLSSDDKAETVATALKEILGIE